MPYQRDALARHSVIAETFETACTWDTFETLHRAVTEAARQAMREVTGTGVVTCRFTHVYPDGPAPYFGVYAPAAGAAPWPSGTTSRPRCPRRSRRRAARSPTTTRSGATTARGTTGSAPGPFAAALSAAKTALDPAGVLNPGVLLPAP
ncbi:hypothetical protein GCM10017687_29180 [Streptomyces echinatus]